MNPPAATHQSPARAGDRNDFLDYLKGALILFVLWGHLIQYIGYGDEPGYYRDPFFKAIYMFHMPLFMAVSGFLSYHAIFKSDLLACGRRRFRQIIIPAICWPLLNLAALLLWCLFRADTPANGLHAFTKVLASFRPGLWFLWALFGSTVVVAALKKFGRDRLEFFAAATIVFLFAPDGANIYLFKYTFPFFCLGYALAKGDQIRIPATFSPVAIAALFALSTGCYLLWTTDSYVYVTKMHPALSNLPNIGLRYLAGMAASVAFVLLLSGFYRVTKSATLSLWGRHSLDIYVIHSYFLVVLAAMNNPLKNSPWFICVAAPVLAGIICAASCLVGRGLSRIPVVRTLLLGQPSKA